MKQNFQVFKKVEFFWKSLVNGYAYKLSSLYLQKLMSFAVFNAQKGHFLRYLRWFRYFSYFQLLSALDHSTSVLGSFLHSWRKSDLKTCIAPPKFNILNLTFFYLVALYDLDFTQDLKRLRRVFRSIPDMSNVVLSALFQFDTADLPGETSNHRLSKILPLTRPMTSSVTIR